jgi:general secretion pathway protein F
LLDEVYRGVVGHCVQSGALGKVIERLADDLEERQELRSKLIGATLYPAIVSLIAVVIVIFLVTYVVPQVASVFTNSKRALPTLTIAMLGISAFLRQWGWAVLLALARVLGFFAERGQRALQRQPGADQAGELPRPDRQAGGVEDAAREAQAFALRAGRCDQRDRQWHQ